MDPADLLTAQHSPTAIVAAVTLAMLASYVALDLARRVGASRGGAPAGDEPLAGLMWWIGGSVAMGTGIWAMHFVAMLGIRLPLLVSFGLPLTLASWAAAVGVSALTLGVAARPQLGLAWQGLGALLMGGGICAMHYIGMLALALAPGIVWRPGWVLLSAVIAVVASAVALALFRWMQHLAPGWRRLQLQAGAAAVMGLAISGMHFSGMAAAQFPAGAVCTSVDGLSGAGLGLVVGFASTLLLGATLLGSLLDARLQGRAAQLAGSLQAANDQLQQANESLRRIAFVDPLTGLPNRHLFEDRLAHAVRRVDRAITAARPEDPRVERLALLFIDLDGFKPVNDLWGHAVGDQVLREVARRLAQVARASDTLARVGGDEFLCLMEGLDADAQTLACQLGERLLQALGEAFDCTGQEVRLSAAIGVAIYPEHGSADRLVARADSAMYMVKRSGGRAVAVYDPSSDAQQAEQVLLLSELRKAAARGELQLHYQPKLDCRRGTLRGAEALLRWQHPQRGMISPALFVPLAERFGLIVDIGNWVIDEAARQMAAWADEGVRLRVAINLSPFQLRQDGLVARVDAALRRHGLDPAQLVCEITESVAMDDSRATQAALDGLAALGIRLSIDDFGTGYSSLSYLRRLRASQLKIDRSFVKDLETSSDARAVVQAVIRLAHALDLEVVAEGVETEGQRQILARMDCDELQGFLFARPQPAGALLAWVLGDKPPGALVDFSPSTLLDEPGGTAPAAAGDFADTRPQRRR